MISIEEGLQQFLTAHVMGITGGVHPLRIKQGGHMPQVTYQRLPGTKRYPGHDAPTDFVIARIQVSCWSEKYLTAKAIAKAIRLALNGYSGPMGTTNPVSVQGAQVKDDYDDYIPEAPLGRVVLPVILPYKEEI